MPKYLVKSSVKVGGRMYPPGSELECSAERASLIKDEYLEQIQADPREADVDPGTGDDDNDDDDKKGGGKKAGAHGKKR